MGKTQSKISTEAMKKARKYFEAHEINDVMEIFKNLQEDERLLEGKSEGSISTHAGIDIETFGEYFAYPGVLREQIFKVFDSNKDGLIDREEFMRGLAMCCRGSLNEKLEFCFGMFDLSGDGFIDKIELHKCLASTAFASFALLQAVAVEQGFMKDEDCLQPEEFNKEVDSMVEDAFDVSDHNGDNKLSFEEFKRWMIKTPEVTRTFSMTCACLLSVVLVLTWFFLLYCRLWVYCTVFLICVDMLIWKMFPNNLKCLKMKCITMIPKRHALMNCCVPKNCPMPWLLNC
jgi:Ca2+-binding EF-hand superfamily protein|tara:strand:+ start:237 stop:1100 length:864 start_codon:yes stop_codon:yes gene_type:complete